jgi:hypothetical protein
MSKIGRDSRTEGSQHPLEMATVRIKALTMPPWVRIGWFIQALG